MSTLNFDTSNSDEDFFSSLKSGQSNLNSLFGVTAEDNNAVQNMAPKKQQNPYPAETVTATNAVESWSAQVAAVVTAYKDSAPVGRVGIALLKNTASELKIIIYRKKSNVLAKLTLWESKLYRQPPYLQFYDDTASYWSVLFDQGKEHDFLMQIPKEYASVIEQSATKYHQDPIEENLNAQSQYENDDCQGTNSPTTTTKATLLSRMAKMGQQLPKVNSPLINSQYTTTDMSDSSDTEVIQTPMVMATSGSKPIVTARKMQKLPSTINKQTIVASNLFSVPAHNSLQEAQQNTQYINMLLCENRTQNTELRMNISKLETKIEKVLDKIDLFGDSSTSLSSVARRDDEILHLEEKVLELRKENRTLKQEQEKTKSQDAQRTFASLQKHKDTLNQLNIRLSDVQSIDNGYEDVLNQLLENIAELQANVLESQKQKELVERNNEEMHSRNDKLETEVLQLKESLIKSNLEHEKVCRELTEVQTKLKLDTQLESVVKEIMNKLYNNISEKLLVRSSSTELINVEEVLKLCGSAIRHETIDVIKKLKQ